MKTLDVLYFERDFPWDVDVEEMHFSMSGYKFSYNEYQNQNSIQMMNS